MKNSPQDAQAIKNEDHPLNIMLFVKFKNQLIWYKEAFLHFLVYEISYDTQNHRQEMG